MLLSNIRELANSSLGASCNVAKPVPPTADVLFVPPMTRFPI